MGTHLAALCTVTPLIIASRQWCHSATWLTMVVYRALFRPLRR